MKQSPKAFPSLELLFLDNLINLEKICLGQLGEGSFSKLRVCRVRCCGRLLNLLSFSMVKGLPQLQEFEVTDCKNIMEPVFPEGEGEISEIETTGEMEFPQLRFLTLQNLPKLISFCSDDKRHSTSQQGKLQSTSGTRSRTISLFDEKVMFCKLEYLKLCALNIQILWHEQLPRVSSLFKNLTTLVVEEGCNNLKCLFPSFMVEVLVKLKTLEISSCKFLEEVIAPMSTTLLPDLVSLSLHGLPELKRFCEADNVEFPVLKELCIRNCPLFGKDSKFQQIEYFPRLKVVKLIRLRKESTILSCFFKSFSKIPELILSDASFSEIFQGKGFSGKEEDEWKLDQLSKLSLSKLPELTDIWKESSQPQLVLQNLGTLKILGCGRLKDLVPSSVSFQSLKTLEVLKCHGFIYLITPSTAKSMGELKMMSITDCRLIEKIIANEDNGLMDGLVFRKLKYLRLQRLPSLTSFYSGNDTFQLPWLDELVVRECPKMEIFHKGELTTSGNLNATIDRKKSQNHVKELGSLQWKIPDLWESTV